MRLSTILLTAGGFLSFFVFGFIDNLKGPLLPEILRSEGMSYGQGGTFFLAAYVGFVIATLSTGIMADLLSNRRVLLLAGVCLLAGIIGMNLTSSLLLLNLSMGLVGMGLGAIELGANGLMVELHSTARARYLNLLATFHGVGSLLVPLMAAWLISKGLPWPQIYLCAGTLVVLLVALCGLTRHQPREHKLGGTGWNWNVVLREGFTARMCWFYLLICAYVAVELGIAAWLVEYLQKVEQMSLARSSLYLSGFFALIMLGRFFGSWWVERVGYLRMIAAALCGTLMCLAGGLYGPNEMRWMLPLSGLFMAIVFPTVAAAVAATHQANVGSIFGILFTFGGVGGALGPWVVGQVSDSYGLQTGLASTLVFCGVAIVALLMLKE